MLKLKLQYFDHLMLRVNSLDKTLMLGKIQGRKRRRQQKIRQLNGIINSMNMNLIKFQEIVKSREAWGCCSPLGRKELDTTEGLSNNNDENNNKKLLEAIIRTKKGC